MCGSCVPHSRTRATTTKTAARSCFALTRARMFGTPLFCRIDWPIFACPFTWNPSAHFGLQSAWVSLRGCVHAGACVFARVLVYAWFAGTWKENWYKKEGQKRLEGEGALKVGRKRKPMSQRGANRHQLKKKTAATFLNSEFGALILETEKIGRCHERGKGEGGRMRAAGRCWLPFLFWEVAVLPHHPSFSRWSLQDSSFFLVVFEKFLFIECKKTMQT